MCDSKDLLFEAHKQFGNVQAFRDSQELWLLQASGHGMDGPYSMKWFAKRVKSGKWQRAWQVSPDGRQFIAFEKLFHRPISITKAEQAAERQRLLELKEEQRLQQAAIREQRQRDAERRQQQQLEQKRALEAQRLEAAEARKREAEANGNSAAGALATIVLFVVILVIFLAAQGGGGSGSSPSPALMYTRGGDKPGFVFDNDYDAGGGLEAKAGYMRSGGRWQPMIGIGRD